MPTYRLVESAGTVTRILRAVKMCFLNVLRLHVSQSQRQKRLYKQYMEQLAGAYVERCTDLNTGHWDPRYRYRGPSPDWRYSMSCEESWYEGNERSYCGSECTDSGRCSSPCCSEVIFNGGQHFSGKRTSGHHVCRRFPICYPGNFGYLATGNSFNALSFTYRIGATTIREIVRDVCDHIWLIMQPIYMPQKTAEDWVEIADQFYARTDFPNVIGALDGKHIRLIQPDNSGSSFFNYKKYHSMVLMAWTDADYKFIYVDIGAYGGSCDSSVFKNSNMGMRLEENSLNIPNGRKLPEDNNGKIMPFYLVADDAFGLSNNILRPYAKRNLSVAKKIYNYRHTRARRMVECTFGILANKWRIFHRPLDVNLDFAESIIKTCCVLHNLVRMKDGIQFTDTLYEAPFENITSHSDNRGRNVTGGINVRQYLTSYFVSPQGSVSWQYSQI